MLFTFSEKNQNKARRYVPYILIMSIKPGFHIATGGAQPHKSPLAASQSRHEVYLSQAAVVIMRYLRCSQVSILRLYPWRLQSDMETNQA